MKCAWDNCSMKSTSLVDHIYYVHVECMAKDSGPFSCKWRTCKHDAVFEYRSLLSLHLRSHLKELIQNRDATDLILPDIKKEPNQDTETDSEIDGENDNSYETMNANLSGNVATKEIICIQGEKVSCPVESCDSVSNII